MTEPIRALLLQPDLELAQLATSNLREFGVGDLECVANGIECIACFESFRPQLTLVDADADEMPVRFIVEAIRQLDPQACVWIWSSRIDSAIQAEARAIGAMGAVTFPLDRALYDQLLPHPGSRAASLSSEDETVQGFVDDSASLWEYRGSGQKRAEVESAELNVKGEVKHVGDLKVVGNLRNMAMLDVSGSLEVHGNVVNSHIRCRGDVMIYGGIIGCRERGVFARQILHVDRIRESMVVCGGSLLLKKSCEASIVNVAGRMIGKSGASSLSGGKARVGEYMMIGVLGDDAGTETRVEIACNIFFQHWVRSRNRLFGRASDALPEERRRWFERQIADRASYQRCAELIANVIYPGVRVKLGDIEDVITQTTDTATRGYLAQCDDGAWALAFDRRPEPVTLHVSGAK